MPIRTHSHLSLKIIALGGIVAALLYLLHPGVGQLEILINGQPIAEPLFRLPALLVLLVAMLLVGGLSVLALFGVGMMVFFAALGFAMAGILLIAPYFWPVLLLFCMIIVIMSSGANTNSK